eukprot:scaffold3736_cov74-Phaeocystis_antarctica.AAC.2
MSKVGTAAHAAPSEPCHGFDQAANAVLRQPASRASVIGAQVPLSLTASPKEPLPVFVAKCCGGASSQSSRAGPALALDLEARAFVTVESSGSISLSKICRIWFGVFACVPRLTKITLETRASPMTVPVGLVMCARTCQPALGSPTRQYRTATSLQPVEVPPCGPANVAVDTHPAVTREFFVEKKDAVRFQRAACRASAVCHRSAPAVKLQVSRRKPGSPIVPDTAAAHKSCIVLSPTTERAQDGGCTCLVSKLRSPSSPLAPEQVCVSFAESSHTSPCRFTPRQLW